MSLQVWLPLNGDLHNQGLSNIQPILMGTGITYSNGKIGQAATFPNNCNSCIHFPGLRLQTGSWAAWIKVNGSGATTRQCAISEGRDSYTDGVEFYLNQAGTSLTFKAHEKTISTTIELNKWYHAVGTFGNGEVKFYLDGILKGTQTYTNDMTYQYASDFTLGKMSYSYNNTSNYFSFNGQLNDVRIYDHALSAKEVKEIAKGLVLHYKLDNNGMGGDNLYTGTKDFTGSWINASNWTTDENTYNGFTVKKRSGTWGGLAQNISATNGDIFTISFWAKMDLGGKLQSVHRSNLGNVTTGLTILNGNFSSGQIWVNTNEDGTVWHRYWATVQIVSADITYLQWRIENSVADKFLYVAGFKLEKGSIATSWSPALGEFGTDNSIIYDVSGYGHAATVNAITWSSPSTRYSVAAHFGSTSSKIHITNFPTSGFGNSYSFAWWGKRSSNSPMFWGFSDGIRLNGMYLGNLWNTGDSSNNPLYKIGTTTQVTVPSVNVWHHYVMTGNGTKCYVYLDGELWAEAKTYKAISGTSIYLNGWDSGTSYCSDNTDMSDFRIYATALSAEDVLELYHTSASIDHDGNIYAREFNNIESLNNFEINHRGQMIPVDQFIERNEKLASIIKNDDVLGGCFYEY